MPAEKEVTRALQFASLEQPIAAPEPIVQPVSSRTTNGLKNAPYQAGSAFKSKAALMMKINLLSPCELLPLNGLLAAVQRLKGQCERQYHKLFLDELRSFCISEDTTSRRVNREPVTFIFVLGIAAMASAGVGIEIYAVHEIDKVKVLQNEIYFR
ncbi:unnamed protein product [Allacma fusca]|uniref:Uncharacterized protein n=1 Tax=Allacma fusca TaxID=39272 RepID=A0A8J2L0K4_9HEXA|nr:unnamed protein product [Allacma fusca]